MWIVFSLIGISFALFVAQRLWGSKGMVRLMNIIQVLLVIFLLVVWSMPNFSDKTYLSTYILLSIIVVILHTILLVQLFLEREIKLLTEALLFFIPNLIILSILWVIS